MTPKFLSLPDAAARIRVRERTIRRYIDAGLTAYSIGRRKYVREDELLAAFRSARTRENESQFRANP